MNTPDRALDELTVGEIDEADLLALERIAAMYTLLDPPPRGLVDRVIFGITLDSLHAEVADLQRAREPAGVRGEYDGSQSVTFASKSLTTMVTITVVSADRVRIDGWVVPGDGVHIELRFAQAPPVSTVADQDGRFVLDGVPRELAKFVLRPPFAEDAEVVTPSIQL